MVEVPGLQSSMIYVPVSSGSEHLLTTVSVPAAVALPGSQMVETHSVGSMPLTAAAGSVHGLTIAWVPQYRRRR